VAAAELQIVLVTPETTLLDVPVRSLRFPLYDGQIGILPGRAPLLGRLGYGPLVVTRTDGSSETYFLEGGFAQVKSGIVSILTDRAMPIDEIDADEARKLLAEASSRVPTTDAEFAARDRDQERARRMLAATAST